MVILVLIVLFAITFSYFFLHKVKTNNQLQGVLKWKSGRKKAREIYKNGGISSLEDLIKNNELLAVAILTSEDIKDIRYKDDLATDLFIETSGINHFLQQKIHSSAKHPTPRTFNTVRSIYVEDLKRMKNKNKELERAFFEFKKSKVIPEEFDSEISRISLLQENLGKNLKKS